MMGMKESSSGSLIGRLATVILGFCVKADTSIVWSFVLCHVLAGTGWLDLSNGYSCGFKGSMIKGEGQMGVEQPKETEDEWKQWIGKR